MVDIEHIREIIATSLTKVCGCPCIRGNQNAEPPKFPYISYVITSPKIANNGTFGEGYEDDKARKGVKTVMSLSFLSDDEMECLEKAEKAHEWLDYIGTEYLNDNGVIVHSLTSVTSRDNFLTVDCEYKKGFDCTFWSFDEVDTPDNGTIESIDLSNSLIEPTIEELQERLANRLSGR